MTAGPDDLMILPYTSGTTGKPKACMHTHRSALFTAVLQARWYGLDGGDVMTGFMPLFHVAGMQGSMNAAVVTGATLLLMARWDKDLLPDLFETYGVTFWNAAPTMIVDVLASARFRDRCFAKLKVLTGGGAAMPTAVAERLKSRFGLEFVEGYGMTETMSPTHINPMAAPKPSVPRHRRARNRRAAHRSGHADGTDDKSSARSSSTGRRCCKAIWNKPKPMPILHRTRRQAVSAHRRSRLSR